MKIGSVMLLEQPNCGCMLSVVGDLHRGLNQLQQLLSKFG